MKRIHLPSNVSIKPPELIAQRGYALRYPENTLQSLRAAIEAGARYIEFDVQLTADGVPVLSNDTDLWRTARDERSVLDLTLDEVMQVEVNETTRLGPHFTGVHIPLLGEVATLIAEHANLMAFVEIRRASLTRFGVDRVVPRVLEELAPVLARCVVTSLDREALLRARQVAGAAIGWILEEWGEAPRAEAERLAPEYLFCDYRLVPDDCGLWPGPWRWGLHDVIDHELALALAACGAELVQTPAVRELLKAMRLI